uniref:TANC2 n=1 Tax=Syphacia muris TaxID=451379 RepID=A0A0N5AAW6_9BILA
TVHVPSNTVPGTHFVGSQHVVHVFSEPHLSTSAYYSPSESMSVNTLPPPLSPQQSPTGFQFSELIASEYDSAQPQDNSWDIVNYNTDTEQLSRQTNRKIAETPPVLKRMLTSAVGSQSLESDLLEGALSFSGQMRCFMRQHGELGESSEVVFPGVLRNDDSNMEGEPGFGHLRTNEAEVLPVVQKTGVCRVGGGAVSLKPTILASGNKRYRLFPSVKGTPYSGPTIYAQSPQNTFRLSTATVPYLDGRYVSRNVQDAVVSSNVTTASRRISQRSSTGIPVLDRFSSTTHLSGVPNLYTVSQSPIQSSDAGCVSSLVPKTRMC